jgi:hypothetical protein
VTRWSQAGPVSSPHFLPAVLVGANLKIEM